MTRTLHHCWLNPDDPPSFIAKCIDSAKELHTAWHHQLHRTPDVLKHSAFDSIRPDLEQVYFDVLPKCEKARAYQADLLRLCILFTQGGVTLDADLYFIQPLDDLTERPVLLAAHPGGSLVTECVMGADPGHPLWLECLRDFVRSDIDTTRPQTIALHRYAAKYKLPVLPPEYFSTHRRDCPEEKRYHFTKNTRAIHCYHQSFTYDLARLASIRDEIKQQKRREVR